jgi:hypothetical protein
MTGSRGHIAGKTSNDQREGASTNSGLAMEMRGISGDRTAAKAVQDGGGI